MNLQPILLIPEKKDVEFEQVAAAWTNKGGQIKRPGKYWIKDEQLANYPIAIYGGQAFALVLAQIYNLQLVSPDDTLITLLENKWTKRDIQLSQIMNITESDLPAFVKPVVPKMFLAGIFNTLTDFHEITQGLEANEAILISTIVPDITAEARSFVLDGIIKDIALYEGSADTAAAIDFLTNFLQYNKHQLPRVVVIDLAYSEHTGWFVLEFNACWGAGLNNCSSDKVIDCIIAATDQN